MPRGTLRETPMRRCPGRERGEAVGSCCRELRRKELQDTSAMRSGAPAAVSRRRSQRERTQGRTLRVGGRVNRYSDPALRANRNPIFETVVTSHMIDEADLDFD